MPQKCRDILLLTTSLYLYCTSRSSYFFQYAILEWIVMVEHALVLRLGDCILFTVYEILECSYGHIWQPKSTRLPRPHGNRENKVGKVLPSVRPPSNLSPLSSGGVCTFSSSFWGSLYEPVIDLFYFRWDYKALRFAHTA